MFRLRIRGDRRVNRTHLHGVCSAHDLVVSVRRACASCPSCSLSTVVAAYRYASTAASSGVPFPPSPSSRMAPTSESPPWTTSRSPRISPPPPLSLLSWAVDGSGHTHHGCRRRLSMAERIPLVCETIRATASDVVALQDSTPELAEALTESPQESTAAKLPTPAVERRLRIHCAELARELQYRLPGSALLTSSSSFAPVAPLTTEAPVAAGCREQQPQSTETPASLDRSPRSPVASLSSCRYRLIGRARNGRCGEVQLFIKKGSVWDAQLLPGMGAGLTVELSSRTCTALPPRSLTSNAPLSDSAASETGDATESVTKRFTDDPAGREAGSLGYRCVLTTLDLSYRGKSLGTNAKGLLADAAISTEGSPFTLQAQQPSSLSAAKRHRRAPGQLDSHRAMVLDWVYHHVRPDVLVGNLFTGAREHVPGFEDTWVRAGSPVGQERTTNTCARHRVDRVTNYFYFRPSRRVASPESTERLTRVDNSKTTVSMSLSTPPTQPSTADGAVGKAGASETTIGQTTEATTTTVVAVAADAPVGTLIPLTASRDGKRGSWHVRSSSACATTLVKRAEHRGDSAAASGAKGAEDGVSASGDITLGMPEVAGRFQRCLLRSWERRGPASRSGHLSAYPFLRQYRYCRVVVLRPTVEVELSASEQAWHARYLTAQYAKQRPATSTPSATAEAAGDDPESEPGEAEAAAADAPQTTRVEEASSTSPQQARVSSRVRCSVSDQYPLLTLLA